MLRLELIEWARLDCLPCYEVAVAMLTTLDFPRSFSGSSAQHSGLHPSASLHRRILQLALLSCHLSTPIMHFDVGGVFGIWTPLPFTC